MRREREPWPALGLVALLLVAALAMLLASAGCGSAGEEAGPVAIKATSAPIRTAPPSTADLCGDGVCDAAEQQNPALCPHDCPPADTPTPTPTVTPTIEITPPGNLCGDGECDEFERLHPELCPTDCITITIPGPSAGDEGSADEGAGACVREEWWLVVEGCSILSGTEPSGNFCIRAEGCIQIPAGETCTVEGILEGRYDVCDLFSSTGVCSYEVECPESFEVPVSGVRITDTLQLTLDGSGIWEQFTATCAAGVVVSDRSAGMQLAFGSVHRNHGFAYSAILPLVDGIHVDEAGVDAVTPDNLRYDFDLYMHKGCR